MSFAHPENFIYLWLVIIAAIILFFVQKKLHRRLRAFAQSRLEELMTHNISPLKNYAKMFLFLVALTLILFSMTQPRWGFEWRELPQGGIDIMVVLDVSKSMEATDLQPSRMEQAKREIIDLLGMLQGDRIGVVAFAGVPFVQCPLTRDYRMAKMFMSQISTDLIPVQGTNLGAAVNLAAQRLGESSASDGEGKAIIVITDGEDHDEQVNGAIELAKKYGIKIFAVGIGGQEGAPIPDEGGGFKKDEAGNVVVTKLNEEVLKKMAVETNGMYVRSSAGEMDLDQIYKQGIRATIDDKESGTTRQKVWFERFQWFLGFGVLLLFLEFFIKGYKKRTHLTNVLLFLLFVGSIFQSGNSQASQYSLKEAKKHYDAKEYEKAEKQYLEAEIDEPENNRHAYNRAVSQFQNNKFEEAIQGFQKAAQDSDKNLAADSYFNLGNSLVAMDKLEEALTAYQKTLEINANDQKAKENMQWVQEQIKKKEEEKKKEQQNKEQQNKDEKKEDKQEEKSDNKNNENKDQQQQKEGNEQKQDDQQQGQNGKEEKESQKTGEEQKKEGDPASQQQSQQQPGQEGQQAGQQAEQKEVQGMTESEADALLRSVEGKQEYYGVPPKFEKPKQRKAKDW